MRRLVHTEARARRVGRDHAADRENQDRTNTSGGRDPQRGAQELQVQDIELGL